MSRKTPDTIHQVVFSSAKNSAAMAFTHYIRALVISTFILSTTARHAPPHRAHQHKHEAIRIGKRQSPSPPAPSVPAEASALTTADPTTLTYITPSPSAEPVAVTEQSQIVPSGAMYIPLEHCKGWSDSSIGAPEHDLHECVKNG